MISGLDYYRCRAGMKDNSRLGLFPLFLKMKIRVSAVVVRLKQMIRD